MLSERAKSLRPAVQAAFDAGGIDVICELIAALIAPLEARIAELEKRLNMTNSNCSKPPSSDGLKRKTKSTRPNNTGRKPVASQVTLAKRSWKTPLPTSPIPSR